MRLSLAFALTAALLAPAAGDDARQRVREQSLRAEIESIVRKSESCAARGSFREALETLRRAEIALLALPARDEATLALDGRLKTLRRGWTPQAEAEGEAVREARLRAAEADLVRELAQEASRREAARKTLVERFEDALSGARWTEAERWLRVLREGSPRDPLLEGFALRLAEARHGTVRKELRESMEEEWRNLLELATEQQVPYSGEILRYPEGFLEASRAREDRLGQQLAQDEAWRTGLREKLARRVRCRFDKTPFPEALSVLETAGGLTVNIDRSARDKVPDLDALPVTFSAPEDGMALDTALTWLLKGTGLSWGLGDESLRISTPEGIQEAPVLQRHDVRDVLGAPLDFPGPSLTLQQGGTGVDLTEAPQEEADLKGDDLVDFIKTQVMPFAWSDPQNSLSFRQGTLFVNAPPAVQRAVREVLTGFREQRTLQVLVQTRFLTIEDTTLEQISVDWFGLDTPALVNDAPWAAANQPGFSNPRGLRTDIRGTIANRGTLFGSLFPRPFGGGASGTTPAGGLAMQVALLDNFQLQAVFTAVEKGRKASMLSAPSVLCFNTQRANLLSVSQMAYIQDVTAVVQVGIATFDPDIGYTQTGVVLDVRPIVSSDRKYVTLDLKPTLSRVERMREFLVEGPGGAAATIEGPVLDLRAARTTVSVPDGGTLLVGGLSDHDTEASYATVPFLSKIPFLKPLFSSQWHSDNRRNQLILVKVQIVDPHAGAERLLGKP